ncbi:hypothetical protein [Methylobacterium sp. E-045]|uniref:hypothetical protein n=1 Tax=Methylobacterium sp. E-045 TaxID=2836575 RepID=UPI001FBABCB3|nr:hypothetical protein [Methylobacterium sp. E-045]MCJ2128310.1 hypothetical protein [Methylobacterium sp. E-045]
MLKPMIDREARDRAADLVEQFWSGLITNRDLERGWPESRDVALRAINDLIWTLYDDFETCPVRQAIRTDQKLSILIPNCVAFLRSDEIYTWPHSAIIKGVERIPLWAVILSLGTLSLWNRRAEAREERYWADMRAHGDVEAWPFRRNDQWR